MEIIQDTDKALLVMHEAATWRVNQGVDPGDWWKPENMNRDFMLQHSEPDEYYVALEHGKPAASVILEDTERNQDWSFIDKDNPKKALYVHWLCVTREFAGKGYSKIMIDFAEKEAQKRGLSLLRLDTDADEEKLCRLYEGLGFHLMGIEGEGDHGVAYYQKEV